VSRTQKKHRIRNQKIINRLPFVGKYPGEIVFNQNMLMYALQDFEGEKNIEINLESAIKPG